MYVITTCVQACLYICCLHVACAALRLIHMKLQRVLRADLCVRDSYRRNSFWH